MTARTRVLHVITHLDRGGATDNTLLSVAGLDRSRYEVDLAAGPGVLETSARTAADRLVVVPALTRAPRPAKDLRAALALWRLAAGYDVVHTHTAKAGVLGRLVARARGVPVVVHTIHAFPVHDGMSPVQHRLLLWAERLAAACADRIIAVCQANAAEALALGIATARQLRVVPSGVPVAAVRAGSGERVRQALGIPAGAPVVGTVTRFMEQKAPLDLVAAGRLVVGARADAHLLVVGDGPLRAQVERAAAGQPRIHLLGYRDDVPDVLAAVDVVAFSSRWEGLGRALTEAVVAARPVVATAVNGVPDLVVEGVTGHLVPPGRPDLLADRVLQLLARPDRGAAMGAAGAARVADRFDLGAMLAGLDAVYREASRDRARARLAGVGAARP
ncbi:MAG TPA: glycosyltransferase [Actinomycetota bacterium]|jgi:glycosyltransferase involved in cell wall biosynthesis|nr:glycosyltransferase [Actinomycetota bacterium]